MAASLYFKAGNRTTDFLVNRSLATCQLADLRFSDSDVVSIIFCHFCGNLFMGIKLLWLKNKMYFVQNLFISRDNCPLPSNPPTTGTQRLPQISVTWLGEFWKVLATNLHIKISQKDWWLFWLFLKKITLWKNALKSIWHFLETVGLHFYSNIWSHWHQ